MSLRNSVQLTLAALRERRPDFAPDSAETPLFLFSAAWPGRARGLIAQLSEASSFLDQPLGEAGIVTRMTDLVRASLRIIEQPNGDPESGNPALELICSMIESDQATLTKLFADSTQNRRSAFWGFAETRLSIDDARYLKFLFPQAKFVFVVGDPYQGWLDYLQSRPNDLPGFLRWPGEPLTVRRFAREWARLAKGFVEEHTEVGGLLIREEDLAGEGIQTVASYLEREFTPIPDESANQQIRNLDPHDLHVLHTECGSLATQLNYGSELITREGVANTKNFRANDRSRCVVLVPVGSTIYPDTEVCLKRLEQQGYPVRRVYGFAAIDQGRNQMVTDALRDGFEETLWIDSDMAFPPDAVDRIRAHNLPITTIIAPQKGRKSLACHVMPGTQKLTFGNEGGLIELLYAGTGFLHVRREAYDTIKQKLAMPTCNQRFKKTMEPFFQPLIRYDEAGSWYLAEDFAFCHRAREAGLKIMADTSLRIWHIGNYAYGWEDAGIEKKRYGTFHYNLGDGTQPEAGK